MVSPENIVTGPDVGGPVANVAPSTFKKADDGPVGPVGPLGPRSQ